MKRRDFLVAAGIGTTGVAGQIAVANRCWGYPIHQFVTAFRRRLFPQLHPLDDSLSVHVIPPEGESRDLIQERGDEYVLSVRCGDKRLWDALCEYGYVNNWPSTLKYVKKGGGKVWESGAMAYRNEPTSPWMHHVYWFPASDSDSTFHISHHKERNYLDIPDGTREHTSRDEEHYTSGDPDGHLRDALNRHGVATRVIEDEQYEV
jgi:hypothetical protein